MLLRKEDHLRKEKILNLIILGIIFLAVTGTVINFFWDSSSHYLIFEIVPGIILLFFLSLKLLLKRIPIVISSSIIIGIISLIAYYLEYGWGTMVPESWILLALTIVIGGILVSSRFSSILIVLHSTVLLVLTYLQLNKKIIYRSWETTPSFGSIVVAIISLTVIALISWLSNREIERSLRRAKKSEKKLQQQRDLLELKVTERTREIQAVKMEEFTNLHKFASIGRLAAGLIHELATPLTTIALNLELLKNDKHSHMVNRAIEASKKISQYVEVTRKQMQHQDIKKIFSLKKEIVQTLKILSPKASDNKIQILLNCENGIKIFGNNLLFSQLITNLVNNALDAYDRDKKYEKQMIEIKFKTETNWIVLTITDWGNGIASENLTHIFEPFFTTKNVEKGTGIGLTISRDIVEKDFKGTIGVKSKINEGTTFTVKFPIIKIKND